MKLQNTFIDGLVVLVPEVYHDSRGYFCETFNLRAFKQALGVDVKFVQDNLSMSHMGVLRGLHYQKNPHEQGKLVKVLTGAVLDVAVDLRPNSSTFLRHFAIELSQSNHKQLWIPEGFAHGFVATKDNTIISYKTTNYYAPSSEVSILYNDKHLAIDWSLLVGINSANFIISDKDNSGVTITKFLKMLGCKDENSTV